MLKTLSFCAAVTCLLSACAGQPPATQTPGPTLADDDYVPTGSHLPRKKAAAPAGITVVDATALDNGRNTHAPGQ